MKTTKLLAFFAVMCLLFTTYKTAQAQETIEEGNIPMGYYAEDERSPMQGDISRGATLKPDDLDASDTSLPKREVIDISSYQSWMNAADFQKVKAQGVHTVVVKLTQGITYINPSAKQQINFARQAGLNVAVYHYTTLGYAGYQAQANDMARQEAKFFADTAKSLGLSRDTVMINDAEDPYVSANINWNEASLQFVNQLRALGFGNIRHYTSLSWTTAKNKLVPTSLGIKNMWIAQYLYGKPSSNNLLNTQFGAWQYTSRMYFRNLSQSKPIDTSISYRSDFFTVSPTVTPVYRLYNKNTGEHFYTTSAFERDSLLRAGWNNENIGWHAPLSGTPVYRIYNPNAKGGDHYYTISKYEAEEVVKAGWRWDNNGQPVFYAGGNRNIYVAFNPNATASGSHNYTIDANEQNMLLKAGWKYGTIAWQGY